jgi:hypothetical protein
MRRTVYLVVALMVTILAFDAHAQMSRRSIKKNNRRIATFRGKKYSFGKDKAYSMIGISVNALNYYGDLSPKPGRFSTDISFTRPAIGLVFSHRFGPRYSLTGTFMYGTLSGSDSKSADEGDTKNALFRYQRNLSFRNRIKELSVVASMDLFENMATYISRVRWTPYAFAGLAVFTNNPQGQVPQTGVDGQPLAEAGTWVNLRPLGTEGQYSKLDKSDANYGIKPYKKIQLAIPIGIGARFRLNEVMDLSVETGFRYTFTDYIDDVSRNYVDLGVFGTNELAKAMSYRSNEIITPNNSYVGRDGKTYNNVLGYGQESKENIRGSKSQKDIYMVTTFKLTYIMGKTFHRAKFR